MIKQFFFNFSKDFEGLYYRLCTYFMEKRTTTSKRKKLWRQVWDVLLFGSPISRMLIWLKNEPKLAPKKLYLKASLCSTVHTLLVSMKGLYWTFESKFTLIHLILPDQHTWGMSGLFNHFICQDHQQVCLTFKINQYF